MAPPLDLAQRQEMSMTERMALLERDTTARLMAEVEICINYVQAIGHALGLREKLRKLDAEIDELRGNGWERDAEPPPTDPQASTR